MFLLFFLSFETFQAYASKIHKKRNPKKNASTFTEKKKKNCIIKYKTKLKKTHINRITAWGRQDMRTLCLIRKGNVTNLKGNFELSYTTTTTT